MFPRNLVVKMYPPCKLCLEPGVIDLTKPQNSKVLFIPIAIASLIIIIHDYYLKFQLLIIGAKATDSTEPSWYLRKWL